MEAKSSLLEVLAELHPDGRVCVDAGLRTSVDGLYAVGELRGDFPGYAVAAAGDGATVAASARTHLVQQGEAGVSAPPTGEPVAL